MDDALPVGAMGENPSLQDTFNAAMGFNQAVKAMAQSGFCGFYLAVDVPGTISAGESFELVPGSRQVSIRERFAAKVFKHLR